MPHVCVNPGASQDSLHIIDLAVGLAVAVTSWGSDYLQFTGLYPLVGGYGLLNCRHLLLILVWSHIPNRAAVSDLK